MSAQVTPVHRGADGVTSAGSGAGHGARPPLRSPIRVRAGAAHGVGAGDTSGRRPRGGAPRAGSPAATRGPESRSGGFRARPAGCRERSCASAGAPARRGGTRPPPRHRIWSTPTSPRRRRAGSGSPTPPGSCAGRTCSGRPRSATRSPPGSWLAPLGPPPHRPDPRRAGVHGLVPQHPRRVRGRPADPTGRARRSTRNTHDGAEPAPAGEQHTAATMLKELGVSPRDAPAVLGHSHVTVTLGICGEVFDQTLAEALGRLDAELRRPAGSTHGPNAD